jgi:hypothetical protein
MATAFTAAELQIAFHDVAHRALAGERPTSVVIGDQTITIDQLTGLLWNSSTPLPTALAERVKTDAGSFGAASRWLRRRLAPPVMAGGRGVRGARPLSVAYFRSR